MNNTILRYHYRGHLKQINKRTKVNPEDHFIKGTENTNFTFIPVIITMGQ